MCFKIPKNKAKEVDLFDCILKKETAIGGRLTFSFLPTNKGVIGKVKCRCGEEVNLVMCEEW